MEKQENKKQEPIKNDSEKKAVSDKTKKKEEPKKNNGKNTNKKAAKPKKEAWKTADQKPVKKTEEKKKQESPLDHKQPKSAESVSKKGSKPEKKVVSKKRKPNILLWVTIVIIAIPCLIMAYILIGSREGATSPVEGDRFEHALDPEITQENLNALQESLQFEDAEKVEINLKSATLRITINTRDDMSQEEIGNLLNTAYNKVNEQLPVETYFTNHTSGEGDAETVIKMYDLEINAYNYIPASEEEKSGQIHISKVKNAAAETAIEDVLSAAKDEKTANEILNPDTSNPPTSEENTEGE